MNGKIDWDRLHAMAADLARSHSTLIAQSPPTDPFYVGAARMRNEQWFADLYHEHGFSKGIHIRRIHYRLVSQEQAVIMPRGAPYRNTDKCAAFLYAAARERAMQLWSTSTISSIAKTPNRCSFWPTQIPRLQSRLANLNKLIRMKSRSPRRA